MTEDVLHLGLSDIALLTRVQRPVVSMWRTRYAASGDPFPAPAHVRAGRELFDGHAFVAWLERTGLGRNPTARDDLAAFAALAAADAEDDTMSAGLTALLCLSRFDIRLPDTSDELVDLADEVDEDDTFLYREITGLGSLLEPVARYATLLADAAAGAPAAVESVLNRQRRRSGSVGPAATAPAARRLVADLALALGTHTEIATPCYADPNPGAGDLLVDLAGRAGDGAAITVATPDGDAPEDRSTRRRLRTHDVLRTVLPSDGDGGFAVPTDAVLLTVFHSSAGPDSDEAVLRRIDDLMLGMDAARCAVVLGPASALTDRLRGGGSVIRDGALRSGQVRGIVRLPAGLLPGKPRTRLALWCLGPLPPGGDDPRTLVADLVGTVLDDTVIADLVTDLVAGVRSARPWESHQPSHTLTVPTRRLLAHDGDLVAPRPARDRVDPDAALERVGVLRDHVTAPLSTIDVPIPTSRPAEDRQPVTLGTALADRRLRLLPGVRIDTDDLGPEGTVQVIGPADLLGTGTGSSIDRLLLAGRYPTAVFTEPGDVVFTTAPRPAAMVDEQGGAVVAYPARSLRVRAPGFVPAVLAADVNAQPVTAKALRSWTVRTVPADQADALTGMLDALRRHRRDLSTRIDQLDQLSSALVTGTCTGTLDLRREDPRGATDQEGRPTDGPVDDEGTQGHPVEGR